MNQVLASYARFTEILESPPDGANQVYRALEQLTQEIVGFKLFTLMKFELGGSRSRRLYTSDETTYPTSGWKDTPGGAWSQTILIDKKPFIANTHAEIAAVLPDHDVLDRMGNHGLLNLPIIVEGQVLGTINCGHNGGHFTPKIIEYAGLLKCPGMLAFQSLGN